LLRVSFLWYSMIATVVTVVVGLVVSWMTNGPFHGATSPARPSGTRILNQATANIYSPKQRQVSASFMLPPDPSLLVPLV
jgi:hypothetical protein